MYIAVAAMMQAHVDTVIAREKKFENRIDSFVHLSGAVADFFPLSSLLKLDVLILPCQSIANTECHFLPTSFIGDRKSKCHTFLNT